MQTLPWGLDYTDYAKTIKNSDQHRYLSLSTSNRFLKGPSTDVNASL